MATTIQEISGGVTAAKGFQASGMHCGIRKNKVKKDLGLLYSEVPATAAAMYTQNLVKGAPITVTKAHLADDTARAVICNSGIANTCAADGVEKAEQMCRLTADALDLRAEDVLVASTGVIGPSINMAPIEAAMPQLAAALSPDGSSDCAQAIMTTDTYQKELAVSFELGGKTCHLGGIAKGSGMIAPNMATMLCFLTTDTAISADCLKAALKTAVNDTFNMLSVDGDTSTNDTVLILANGLAENPEITAEGEDYALFLQALTDLCRRLVRLLAADGEGATRLLECRVSGALTDEDARKVAKSVVKSSLLKAAIFGADANWGRVLCAIGYAGAQVDVTRVDLDFVSVAGRVPVCRNGAGIEVDEDFASVVLHEKEIGIEIRLGDGDACATAWGCDLTYDYVKINGDYRS